VNFRVAFPLAVVLSVALLTVSAALSASADMPAGNWIDVPYVAQARDGCGAAVISMVMQYWVKQPAERSGRQTSAPDPGPGAADARRIQDLLFVPAEKGIPASAMIRYFGQNGYRTYAFRGEWSDLVRHVSQGRPLIVSLKAGGPRGPLHYAVVAGVDWQRNYIFLNDPARGKMLRISREGFLGEWNPANNWTLLAVPAAGD
jgi:ABC-type bacteriocin/lantibiotic exporter with double-glycine peptidase domain